MWCWYNVEFSVILNLDLLGFGDLVPAILIFLGSLGLLLYGFWLLLVGLLMLFVLFWGGLFCGWLFEVMVTRLHVVFVWMFACLFLIDLGF